MRKYQLIWETLKASPLLPPTTSIVAPVESHAKIIQAVKKEKWRDDAFKLLIAEDQHRTELSHIIKNDTIHFILVYTPLTYKLPL